MTEIAQPLDLADGGAAGRLDDLDPPGRALDDDASATPSDNPENLDDDE